MDQLHALVEMAKKEIEQEDSKKKRVKKRGKKKEDNRNRKNITENPLLYNLAEMAKFSIIVERQMKLLKIPSRK